MNKLKLILIVLILISCNRTSGTIEEILTSDNFVRWSKEQNITIDFFEGTGPENTNSMWVGIYFIYDFRSDEFKFDVTTFMDKQKSYFDMGKVESAEIKIYQNVYKLRFDNCEIYARKFRKYLVDNKSKFNYESKESLISLSNEFRNESESKWKEITEDLTRDGYSEERLSELRDDIDKRLEELKDFDSRVNNYY